MKYFLSHFPALKLLSFVMVLGEFEFDDLWNNSSSATSGVSQTFTMLLLTGVIVLGTIIMINLIVAIIITDIDWLKKISQQQVLRNKVISLSWRKNK